MIRRILISLRITQALQTEEKRRQPRQWDTYKPPEDIEIDADLPA